MYWPLFLVLLSLPAWANGIGCWPWEQGESSPSLELEFWPDFIYRNNVSSHDANWAICKEL
jgi:hypothetical protein